MKTYVSIKTYEFMKKVQETVERYGFKAKIVKSISVLEWDKENKKVASKRQKNPSVIVYAKDTDGKETRWFEYHSIGNLYVGNNTDCCNIWLYETRPDLTPEDLVTMFSEIKAELKAYVDPEDWQEIAGVCDAYEDKRYTDMVLNDKEE